MEKLYSPGWATGIVLALVGLAFAALQILKSQDEIRIAKLFFFAAAIITGVQLAVWGMITTSNVLVRLSVCVLGIGLTGFLLIESVRYLNRKTQALADTTPSQTPVMYSAEAKSTSVPQVTQQASNDPQQTEKKNVQTPVQEKKAMPDQKDESAKQTPSIDNRIIGSPIVNSPGSIQAPGGTVNVHQGPKPRMLTNEQELRFVNILKNYAKGDIEISCIEAGGPEPCNFARQIARLMSSRDAGWNVNFSPIMFGAGDPTKTIPELYILIHDHNNPPERAKVLQHALKEVGINAIGIARQDVAQDFVQLTVWYKQ